MNNRTETEVEYSTIGARIRRNNTEQNNINRGFLDRIFSQRENNQVILEEIIDVERDLDIYSNQNINILSPRILYNVGRFSFNTNLIRIYREEDVIANDNEAIKLPMVSQESINKLLNMKRNYAHLGLIIIGIKALHRKMVGTKILIVLIDERWQNNPKLGIISSMEIDMNNNIGLIYCSPNFALKIKDLKHIKIAILGRGYNDFEGEANIMISIGYIGKLTNSLNNNYKVNIKGIISSMVSKGIKMIKPFEISNIELAGLDWELKKIYENKNKNIVPEESKMFKNIDGTYNIRFTNYKGKNKIVEDDKEETIIDRRASTSN